MPRRVPVVREADDGRRVDRRVVRATPGPTVEPEPDAEGVAELLSELEGIVDEAAPDIIADVEKRNRSKGLGRITGRSGKKKKGRKRR